jgi:RNA polymerase sigma-70 factor (ECF subfamily)
MDEDKLQDGLLVLRCQRQEESAFRELVARWEPHLYYYLLRIIGDSNAVWDVLQETWLAVFKSIRKLKEPLSFPAWLYRIGHNKAVNWLQKENKYIQMTNEQITEYSEDIALIPTGEEQAELVHKLLGKLKLIHREVLTLYFLEGFSIKEMAQIAGVPEGTIKSRLYCAKNKLNKASKGANNV